MYIKSKFSHQKKFQSYAPRAWVVNRDRNEYDTDYIKYKNLIFQAREYYEKNNNYKYELIKNDKHCSFCEFNKLCNRQDVVYSMLEEDIYEC